MSQHYALKYQDQLERHQRRLAVTHHYLEALRDYVNSSKFQGQEGFGGDCYIHKNDINLRLEPIISALAGCRTDEFLDLGLTDDDSLQMKED